MNPHHPADDLESELRSALQRLEPPTGFADRVAARLRDTDAALRPGFWTRFANSLRTPAFQVAAAATLCLAVIVGTVEHRRNERQRGEAAKRQLIVAMRITGAKLHYAQQKVQQVGSHQHGTHSHTEE